MVPLWMFPVAIACGNTFVLKPSEKVPLSAVRLGELLTEAGLPEGVFNIVHGDKRVRRCPARRIRWCAAISFVGSTAVARHVYETGTQNGKRVQAAGGAKNHLIIMPDADLDQAVKALAGARPSAAPGERCMAGSVAVPVGKAADPLVERLVDYAGKMRVGPTDGDEDVDMGPVIRAEHRDRVAGYLDIAKGEGADGRPRRPPRFRVGRLPARPERARPREAGDAGLRRKRSSARCSRSSATGDLDEALAIGRDCDLRQRRVDLHPQRLGGPAVQAALQRRHDRHQRRRAGPDGLVPVHRLEPLVLRRPAHPGHRSIQFYTQQKMTLTRWPKSDDSHLDPVWRQDRK